MDIVSNKTATLKVIRSNKKERTITIEKTFTDGSKTRYKSVTLSKDEWHYMTQYATENDIKNFLKSDNYYILK